MHPFLRLVFGYGYVYIIPHCLTKGEHFKITGIFLYCTKIQIIICVICIIKQIFLVELTFTNHCNIIVTGCHI